MELELIISKLCKCCACEGSLESSNHINWVQIDKKATWKFPTWGNLLTDHDGMAVAYICDDCASGKKPEQGLKFAVEFEGTTVIYHDLELLV